jgi:cell wall-associated NlpC family hydrolase
MFLRTILLLILLGHARLIFAATVEYGVAITAAPVMNSPDFTKIFGGVDGKALKTDSCGQVRELEYIAPAGTVFKIMKKYRSASADIFQVKTDEYEAPANVQLYVDGRFLTLQQTTPVSRKASLPSREEILTTLKTSVGSPYVWGGNIAAGVPELAEWFYTNITPGGAERLTLAGLDCSGLLYQTTGGLTPRNTSQLVSFGQSVTIAGKRSAEIANMLQPLDLIVWNGHVIIVLDRQSVIESRLECGKPGNGGVVTTPLHQRLAEIMRTKRPVNSWKKGKKQHDIFVVRRWYPVL